MTASDTVKDGRYPSTHAFTSQQEMDRALVELSTHSQEWVDLPLRERIKIVEQVRKAFPEVWDRWAEYSVAAKGIAERKEANDMEWLEIALLNRMHHTVYRSLGEIRDNRNPKIPGGFRILPNGQVAARVFPNDWANRLTFRGVEVDVWLEPGVSLEEAQTKRASAYKQQDRKGKVALVLGAGNASPLPSSDTFHKLFEDLCVVILKMNPVNSYLGPLLEEGYRALIEGGFLRIVYGGPAEGNYLVHHELVDEIHMTGSDRTYEKIVFGSGEQGRHHRAAGTPLVKKPIEGELGCITPWIVVPGAWSKDDIQEQAAKMAFWMMRNEGYLCFAPRLLVMHKSWPLREPFLKALVDSLSLVRPIRAYYPGSAETQRIFVDAHPEAIEIGGGYEDHVPWTVIPGLDPAATDDICYRRESFSGMCGEVALQASSVPEFLDRAVKFVNRTVWGTLSATLVVSGQSLSDKAVGAAAERAIGDLRYGTVALNVPGVWGLYTMVGPWGGFPGSDISEIQSGVGRVGNFLMLHRPEKTLIKAPFKNRPNPFLSTAKDLHIFSKKLAEFENEPNYWRLPGLFWSAFRT